MFRATDLIGVCAIFKHRIDIICHILICTFINIWHITGNFIYDFQCCCIIFHKCIKCFRVEHFIHICIILIFSNIIISITLFKITHNCSIRQQFSLIKHIWIIDIAIAIINIIKCIKHMIAYFSTCHAVCTSLI